MRMPCVSSVRSTRSNEAPQQRDRYPKPLLTYLRIIIGVSLLKQTIISPFVLRPPEADLRWRGARTQAKGGTIRISARTASSMASTDDNANMIYASPSEPQLRNTAAEQPDELAAEELNKRDSTKNPPRHLLALSRKPPTLERAGLAKQAARQCSDLRELNFVTAQALAQNIDATGEGEDDHRLSDAWTNVAVELVKATYANESVLEGLIKNVNHSRARRRIADAARSIRALHSSSTSSSSKKAKQSKKSSGMSNLFGLGGVLSSGVSKKKKAKTAAKSKAPARSTD